LRKAVFYPKNRRKLQENHNVFNEYSRQNANAAQHPAPAAPLSAKEKIIALRQMMGASAARRYPSESVSEPKISPYQVLPEKSPFVCMFLTWSFCLVVLGPLGSGAESSRALYKI